MFDPFAIEPKRKQKDKPIIVKIGNRFLMFGVAWSNNFLWRISTEKESFWMLSSITVNVMKRNPNIKMFSLIILKLKITIAFPKITGFKENERTD
ncbi:hypothetical protein KAR91_30785 [Candidatus Pacearchaeota archaeon]|nr:hypothetical protein [Candidatus Pacearchaeota archaeon]